MLGYKRSHSDLIFFFRADELRLIAQQTILGKFYQNGSEYVDLTARIDGDQNSTYFDSAHIIFKRSSYDLVTAANLFITSNLHEQLLRVGEFETRSVYHNLFLYDLSRIDSSLGIEHYLLPRSHPDEK